MNKTTRLALWPTMIDIVDLGDSDHHETIRDLVVSRLPKVDGPHIERRVHNLHDIDHKAIEWLKSQITQAASNYLGANYTMDIKLRGVGLGFGKHINTHTELDESDLMVAYWPRGNTPGDSANRNSDNSVAPTFVVEDPSRHLTELRLPFEIRHSVNIAPEAGMLVIGPAHLPHNLWPYMGKEDFIHVVAQVRIHWPDDYLERF